MKELPCFYCGKDCHQDEDSVYTLENDMEVPMCSKCCERAEKLVSAATALLAGGKVRCFYCGVWYMDPNKYELVCDDEAVCPKCKEIGLKQMVAEPQFEGICVNCGMSYMRPLSMSKDPCPTCYFKAMDEIDPKGEMQ